MKFRKKPIVIEAFRIGIDNMPDWFCDKVTSNEIVTYKVDNSKHTTSPFRFTNVYCMINTLEGQMRGDYGDYIIKGVNGEIYPCKPDIFEKTYDKLNTKEIQYGMLLKEPLRKKNSENPYLCISILEYICSVDVPEYARNFRIIGNCLCWDYHDRVVHNTDEVMFGSAIVLGDEDHTYRLLSIEGSSL